MNKSSEKKSCKQCTVPCCNVGEEFIPLTIEELQTMGYILCDEHTTLPIEEQVD